MRLDMLHVYCNDYEDCIYDLNHAIEDIYTSIRMLQSLTQFAPTEKERQRAEQLYSIIAESSWQFFSDLKTFEELENYFYRTDEKEKQEMKKKSEINDTWENMAEAYDLDVDYLASAKHDADKVEHRKSRKAKAKKTKDRHIGSVNNIIGKTASAYGKKMLHKRNRKQLELNPSNYYKDDSYSYSSLIWALT